jgi:hypothetical protein
MIGNKPAYLLSVFLILGILIYGHFEAKNIRIEKINIPSALVPQGMQNFRIVQISDLHFSIINGKELAAEVVDRINKLNPDVVVCTGDLIDRDLQDEEAVIVLFNKIKTRYGMYAVPGNHEFYTGIDKATAFTTKAGFKMIRNQTMTVADWINLTGVDDPAGRNFNLGSLLPEAEILKNVPSKKFNILLKHQPVLDPKSLGLFDLQLSGHVHKGQIFPFSIVTALLYRYASGYFQLSEQARLYVSRGTGTWGPPIRFLCPPEITVIEIIKKQS